MKRTIITALALCFALSVSKAHAGEVGELGVIAYKGIISERLYKY